MAQACPTITDPRSMVNFSCRDCREQFEAPPRRIEDAPDRHWHPWEYFADCPLCGEECGQAPWEKGLMATYGKQTGPRTAEGKARAAQNLDGHPTPEEALRTRFNAMKHGLFARTATYFPARPGKYPHCDGCEHLYNGCEEQPACLKRTELFMRHQIAFETGDPALLADLRADTQAAIQAIINDIVLAIVSTGVEIRSPEWYYDQKGGDFHIVRYLDENGKLRTIDKISAHPLLKTLGDFLAKNNMSLADLNMTPKTHDDSELMRGYLDGENESRETLLDHQRQQTQLLENLSAQIERSRERTQRDPVLIEYSETSDG